jgi:serine phosphatase RsbU (regulator of sigma subunit)/anti-sigma regulatory factor (Ser/Thr protein kinase)
MEIECRRRTYGLPKVKRLNEPELGPAAAGERDFQSVRVVIARAVDALWQADPTGAVTGITECHPALPERTGALDEAEVAQVEQLWRTAVRCAERFSAVYHVRTPGSPTLRNFLIQAVPVFDIRDEVLYWSGHATEVERFADSGTRFISETAAVLSSSLNRATIVNRLAQASLEQFCDLYAVHTVDDDGSVHLEGIADRRPDVAMPPEAMDQLVNEALRSRQPRLLLSGALCEPADEQLADFVRASKMRSAIVVPILVGATCVGTLTFLESERRASFAAREIDVAVVVARQLAMALENIRTFERELHVTERFRFLARITEGLFATLDSTKTLALLLDGLAERFADYALAAVLQDGRLRTLAESGSKAELRDESEREIIASLLERRSILSGSTAQGGHGPRVTGGPLLETDTPLSWMMVPLYSGHAVYGAIVCCSNTRHYDRGDLELLEEIGRRASLAIEHAESFARDRRLIQTLQSATLPTQLASVDGASLSAIYRPAAVDVQVGGDWYDAFDLDDQRVLLTVGDVTGHGLEASIVMGKLRHAINVVAMYERNPTRILDAAERILLRRNPAAIATAFVAIFDSRSRTISYANAGHPYPLLRRRDGTIKELEADGLPLGLRTIGPTAQSVTEPLHDAALLAFYTDGLTEATRDPIAGEKLLHEAIGRDAVFFVESPAQFVERYCLRTHAPDDVAVLVLNFVQSQRWTFESGDRHSARRARREFVASLKDGASPDSDVKAAEFIFGELTANVAQPAARVEIALEWTTNNAVLHVIDRGGGYAGMERDQPADLLTEHGRGLWLIGRLGAQLSVEVLPGFGTHVRAVLPVLRASA